MLIKDGFAIENLGPAILAATLRDEKKNYLVTLTKSAGIILELIDKSFYLLLQNKTTIEI